MATLAYCPECNEQTYDATLEECENCGWCFDVDVDEDLADCPACGHQDNAPMGALGNRRHYRCRACGMMFSHTI